MDNPINIIRAARRDYMPEPGLPFDRKGRMFEAGDTVLVAVSGGPDSVAMLHALHNASPELGITLHVAHLNHGIRGESADMDAEFVRDFAKSLGLPCTVEKVDVPSTARELRMGEEETARKLRYEFLERLAEEIGAARIAVGHTADDRVESVLMNILRGTGVEGLGAIRPVRGKIVRPLLDTWRSEIEDYIAQHSLPFRTDESNADTTYTRNRIRHELIPLLERDYNPQVKKALLRLAEIAASEEEAGECTVEHMIATDGVKNVLNTIRRLPLAMQYRIIRHAIERLKGDLQDVSFEQVDRVAQALASGEDFTITLPSGEIYASSKGGDFRIFRREPLPEPAAFELELAVPGTTAIPEAGVVIAAEAVSSPKPSKLPATEALIDAAHVRGSLRARSVHPGDRIVPFGMRGSKKLQDVFVDRKISRRDRSRAVVVCDDERVLWVVGVVTSELARVTEATSRAIRLSAAPAR